MGLLHAHSAVKASPVLHRESVPFAAPPLSSLSPRAAWSSGGFDIAKEQRSPATTSGVRQRSVRDSPVENHGTSGGIGEGAALSAHASRGQDRTSSGQRGASSNRSMSSGMPAAATAVPIIRTTSGAGGRTSLLPPSPPSTPPASPPSYEQVLVHAHGLELSDHHHRRSDDIDSESHPGDASIDSLPDDSRPRPASPPSHDRNEECLRSSQRHRSCSPTSSQLLSQAAASVAMTARRVPSAQDARRLRTSPSHGNGTAAHRDQPNVGAPLMPDTPEQTPTVMSPAEQQVRHQPGAEARIFLHSLFPSFPTDVVDARFGTAEGSGLEVVCDGWKGAVLDRSRHGCGAQADRTLYVLMPAHLSNASLREDVLSVLDLASERLACGAVVVALEHARMADFASILHGLCYVGAHVVQRGVPAAGLEAGAELSPREGVVLAAIEM